MNRLIVIFVIFILLPSKTLAQKNKVLFKAGLNAYTLEEKWNSPSDTAYTWNQPQIGIQLGCGIEWPLFNKLSLLATWEYSWRNFGKDSFNGLTNNFHYMSLLASLNVSLSRRFKAFMGGQIDYLFLKDLNYSEFNSVENAFLNYDTALIAGLRYQIQQIEIGLGAQYGIPWILQKGGGTYQTYAKSRMLQMYIAYILE